MIHISPTLNSFFKIQTIKAPPQLNIILNLAHLFTGCTCFLFTLDLNRYLNQSLKILEKSATQ